MPHDVERHLRDMKWPVPSASLRDRVLADVPATIMPAGWPERMWFSRAFRWSVGAAMAAMVAVSLRPDASVGGGLQPAGSATAEMQAIQDIVVDAGLPADAATQIARRAVLARTASPRPIGMTAAMQLLDTGGER